MPVTFGNAEAYGVHAGPSILLTKLQPFASSPVKYQKLSSWKLEVRRLGVEGSIDFGVALYEFA